uniref:Uncharacterized protein n=1 Tax=Ralstonia syzygii R24 TaxID=907261 RepID=G3A196_9RALS|nr:hypothetical protein RALSY_10968 [Ralstonia syzygii R24]
MYYLPTHFCNSVHLNPFMPSILTIYFDIF